VNFIRSRRGWLITGVGILLALFLVRPGATRLKVRIASSIGSVLQRDVEIDRVRLRLLPHPGFELENFIVHDDPAFGAEPVLRAQEVSASLRLSSLLRGHLEISRLSLTEPSLNLTRGEDGRWNIEHLLERAARTAVAPTSRGRSETRPAFPYIEAERGRINFKVGAEKKPFALADANYAVWQDSENAWGMRLRAQPLRTDFNLSDMGKVSVNGTWLRSTSLRETPVEFNIQWNEAQLGQLTKLLSGEDRGWRGTVRLSADLTGTPADLQISSNGSLEDFRRYDVVETDALKLMAHCDTRFSTVDHGFHAILCHAPSGNGAIDVSGEIQRWRSPRAYDLTVAAEKVPLRSILSLVRRAMKGLPDELSATGRLEGRFRLHTDAQGTPLWDGGGQAANVRLQSVAAKSEVLLDTVPFTLRTSATARVAARSGQQKQAWAKEPDYPHLTVGPVALKLGRPTPVTVSGWITLSRYNLVVDGDADLPRLLDTARTVGLQAIYPSFTGSAKVNLQLAGNWFESLAPITIGMAQLHSVRADLRGLNAPLEINTATLNLTSSDVRVQAISASLAGARWTGSLSFPRMCASLQDCPVNFDLHADELVTDKLNDLMNSRPPERPWYQFLPSTSQVGKSFLARVCATGQLSASRVVIRNLVGTRFSAQVELHDGKLHLSSVRGDVLGGKHQGDWRASFSGKQALYSGVGTVESLSLSQIGEVMHDDWIRGTLNARYMIDMSGQSVSELTSSAHGTVQFNMRDGALSHILLAGSPLRVRRFAGSLEIRDGQVEVREATLDSPTATFTVNGTASLSRKLDFQFVKEGATGFNVTGTLSEPQVAPAHRNETQAALKP
jgi:AsmA family/AsmA-like C-terminal region